ncbi:MAG: TIGR00366 family protein [Bacillota bacterium]
MAQPAVAKGEKAPAVERMGFAISRSVEYWFPDPFLFAIILLFVVFIMAMAIQHSSLYQCMQYMYKGFWGFLAFAMQMCLILMLGYAVAFHSAVGRLISRLCQIPQNGKQAAALVAFIACVFSWINWGLGLVVGGLMAREMAKNAHARGLAVHYPVLCAAGYTGLGLIWHWGLSGSAPLLSNTPGHFLEKVIGLVPANETIFSTYGIFNSLLILVFAVGVLYLLHPGRPERCRGIAGYAPQLLKEEAAVEEPKMATLADRIENSRLIAVVTFLIMIGSMVWWFGTKGFMQGLDINSVNFCMLIIGLLLYRNPIAYARAIYRGAGAVGGIILQFPFYAGIQGVMVHSGLAVTLAGALAKVATVGTMPVIAWLISGFVNLFIPSGGGEWMTIGDTLMTAAVQIGAPVGKTIMAYGAGDAWTNLFNPFWAIALLAITQIRAREMFGYCIAILLMAIVPYALGLTFIP